MVHTLLFDVKKGARGVTFACLICCNIIIVRLCAPKVRPTATQKEKLTKISVVQAKTKPTSETIYSISVFSFVKAKKVVVLSYLFP